MKIMCISEGDRSGFPLPMWPEVGQVYTFNRVIDQSCLLYTPANNNIVWWEVKELLGYCYNSDIFAPLSEIDETQLVTLKEEVVC